MVPDREIVVRIGGVWWEVDVSHYPDGMPLVCWDGAAPDALLLRPKSLGAFMAGMFLADAWASRGAAMPPLLLPFIPGARQDRLNAAGDYLFTASSVAREINARHFPVVRVLDPHSDVAPALIERCDVRRVRFHDSFGLGGYAGVIAPDGGAEKRVSLVARELKVPVVHAWKSRSVATGEISGFGIEPIAPGHYLVVDDICDGGGTFTGLRNALPTGATADLFVTHGLFSKGTKPLLDHFCRVLCTDSIVGEKPGVEILPQSDNLLRPA